MNLHKQVVMICLMLLVAVNNALAIEIPGVVQYERVIDLSLPVSGVISSVNVNEGQDVEKGELLLELEDVPFKAEIAKLEADVRLLEAEKESAQKDLQRNEELYGRLVLSTVALDEVKVNYVRAESRLNAKKAELQLAKYNYEKSRLNAPIRGKIIEKNIEVGQTIRVDLQTPVLLRLADMSGFIVEAEVTGDRLAGMTSGSRLEVRILGKAYPASFKSSALLTAARSLSQPSVYRVRVRLEQSDPSFFPGLPATIIIPG